MVKELNLNINVVLAAGDDSNIHRFIPPFETLRAPITSHTVHPAFHAATTFAKQATRTKPDERWSAIPPST
ncbi:MAG: hypothetical protein LBV30_05535 [Propionibacteriaceae bacterium]|jgi:hypothetical protein|nr:hypothetical protein [Propionibacteriaceae bacterium]